MCLIHREGRAPQIEAVSMGRALILFDRTNSARDQSALGLSCPKTKLSVDPSSQILTMTCSPSTSLV